MRLNKKQLSKLPPEERIHKLKEIQETKKEKTKTVKEIESLIKSAEEEIRKKEDVEEEKQGDISQIGENSEGLEDTVIEESLEHEEKVKYDSIVTTEYDVNQAQGEKYEIPNPEQEEEQRIMEQGAKADYNQETYTPEERKEGQPQGNMPQEQAGDYNGVQTEQGKEEEDFSMMRRPEEIQELVKTRDVFDLTDFSVMKKELIAKVVKEYVPTYQNTRV
ncbi:MAG: hypothetical protein KAQ85_11710 [Thermodesulfovibrionia bacterium]|nr:hypothetical protein [Thermodesulfovibrionia bacterium]